MTNRRNEQVVKTRLRIGEACDAYPHRARFMIQLRFCIKRKLSFLLFVVCLKCANHKCNHLISKLQ